MGWFGWLKLYRMPLPLENPSACRNSLGANTADACQRSWKTMSDSALDVLVSNASRYPGKLFSNWTTAESLQLGKLYTESCTYLGQFMFGAVAFFLM